MKALEGRDENYGEVTVRTWRRDKSGKGEQRWKQNPEEKALSKRQKHRQTQASGWWERKEASDFIPLSFLFHRSFADA